VIPYPGLTARLGKLEANVHDVRDGIVYFGVYDDDADDCPCNCVALYRVSVEAFMNKLGKAIEDGAVLFSSLLPQSSRE
jgi:hypothetical protein